MKEKKTELQGETLVDKCCEKIGCLLRNVTDCANFKITRCIVWYGMTMFIKLKNTF